MIPATKSTAMFDQPGAGSGRSRLANAVMVCRTSNAQTPSDYRRRIIGVVQAQHDIEVVRDARLAVQLVGGRAGKRKLHPARRPPISPNSSAEGSISDAFR
jgi:hypothetical protein